MQYFQNACYFSNLRVFAASKVNDTQELMSWPVVRPFVQLYVRALTFSLNILPETPDWILMKFHRNVPAMVLLRIFFKEFDSFLNSGCQSHNT